MPVEVAPKPDDVRVAHARRRRTRRSPRSELPPHSTRHAARAARRAAACPRAASPSPAPARAVASSTTSARKRSALLPLSGARSAVTYWPSGLSPRARREPLFSHCASERNGKCRTSAGCQLCSARQRVLDDGVRPEADRDRRVAAVGRLQVRPVRARRIVDRRRRRDPHGHPLGERAIVVGPRHEVAAEREDDAVRRRDGREHVLQRSAARHPELVRVGVDHPVGAVLGRGEPRHVRAPRSVAHLALAPRCRRRSPSRAYDSRISVVPSIDS